MAKLKKIGKAIALGAATYGLSKALAPKAATEVLKKAAVKNPNIIKIKNFDKLFGDKKFIDAFGKVRSKVGSKRFTFMKDGGEIVIGKNVNKELL